MLVAVRDSVDGRRRRSVAEEATRERGSLGFEPLSGESEERRASDDDAEPGLSMVGARGKDRW